MSENRRTDFVSDAALDLDLRVHAIRDLAVALGVSVKDGRQSQVFDLLVGQFAYVGWTNCHCWLAVPRDKSFYAGTRRYRPRVLTHSSAMGALDRLIEGGWIEEQRSRPGSQSRYRSRYRPQAAFLEAIALQSLGDLAFVPMELVRLKDSSKRLTGYRDTAQTRAMRRELVAQNEAIASIEIRVDCVDWRIDGRGLLRNDLAVVNPRKVSLYRVFNGGWDFGGRLYGGFWQNLPSAARLCLRIDGEVTVEHDFRHLHPTFMAAMAGVDFKGADPYRIDGFDRSDVKRSFNILLNAPTMDAAHRAILQTLSPEGDEPPGRRARAVVEAIRRQHPKFSEFWGSGLGLRLQRVDSHLCLRVLARMRALGIVALPVHDSFVVPAQASGHLLEAMESELSQTTFILTPNLLNNI